MSEYHQHVGRRVELRQKRKSLEITAGSHLESLRLALDILADPGDLDAEKIISLAAVLAERITDIQEIDAQLAAISKAIGH